MLFDTVNLYADLCSNHHGNRDLFLRLCEEVRVVGAIPKIQLFNDQTFPHAWAKDLDFPFVPSVFRPSDVDFILPHKLLALKVASVESTYWKLISRCLETDLPLIISTGGMDEAELMQLIDLISRSEADSRTCLMHCVSRYPTLPKEVHLGRLAKIGELLDNCAPAITLGWSSHWPVADPAAFALAWAYGATQFEVHVREPEKVRMALELKMDPAAPATLDEQCAFTPYGLKQIISILKDLPVLDGEETLGAGDRRDVLKYRKRWQKK